MSTSRGAISFGFIMSCMVVLLFAATPSWAGVNCGDTIGPNKIAYLKHDLTCDAVDTGGVNVPALTVEANSILFLGGHSVTCDGIDVGVLMNGSGSRLVYGTVSDCNVSGVEVAGTGGHHIKKVTAMGNSNGFGIRGGSHSNTFIYNTATNNFIVGFIGFNEEKTNENVFRSNTSTDNRFGYIVFGDRNTFKYNLAKNSIEGAGFDLIGNDNVVTKNRAISDPTGFAIFGNRNTLIANLAKANVANGFLMGEGSGYQVIGNRAKNNSNGIFLVNGAINSKVLWNVALGNTEFDLIDENDECDANKWKWNWFKTRNRDCIR